VVLPLGLKHVVNEKQVEWLIKTSPDELAPQLSNIVYELLHEEARHLREYGIPFVKSTVLTDTFKTILRELFETLRANSVLTKWLNLDMGSGKTHLLALIMYLLYAYDVFREELEEYHKLGLDRDIAKKTALLVIDLRTPSEVLKTFLPFFAESLRRVGEDNASQYVKNRIERGEIPIASELVTRLKRDTRLVIIVDELHHALLTYRATENERRWVKGVIDFVTQMMNYLRHYKRGFVVLVASARRDYERLLQIESKDELIPIAENLLSQLGRLEPVLETRWLSLEEAKQIVLKRLDARQDILHPMFDRFIERIIKAESDIPQAQHLRSLIKAIAVYTKNALDLGHNIVAPAHFSEGVLDALFPEGGGIADKYRSIYAHVMKEIESLENVSVEVKEITKLIVNTIFTMSVSGRPDQLIETIKAYKLGRYTLELLPAVTEQDIKSLLEDLGLKDYLKIGNAFEVLSGLTYIHSVKLGNTYIYFVVPVESVVTIFNRFVEERYKLNLVDRERLVDELVGYLHTVSGKVGENAHIIVVSDYSALEEATKRLDPDAMYIIVYAEPELVKYLEKSLRGSASRDIDELIKNWFKEKGQRDLAMWLSEHQKHNVAVIVPVVTEEVLKGVAKFHGIMEAISKVVNDYLLEYVKSSSRLPEEMRRIIEIELTEIHKAVKARFIEALKNFVDACSLALSHVYVYECNFNAEYGLRCSVSLKKIEAKGEVVSESRVRIDKDVYSKVVEMLESYRDRGVRGLAKELVKNVKNYANFVDNIQTARNIVLNYIVGDLKNSNRATISEDMNIYIYGTRVLYIPPTTVNKLMHNISVSEIEKIMGEGVTILKKVEGKTAHFEVQIKKIEEKEEKIERKKEKIAVTPQDEFSRALEEIRSSEKGIIDLSIEFNRESKHTIMTYLNTLRKYIKKIGVRAS